MRSIWTVLLAPHIPDQRLDSFAGSFIHTISLSIQHKPERRTDYPSGLRLLETLHTVACLLVHIFVLTSRFFISLSVHILLFAELKPEEVMFPPHRGGRLPIWVLVQDVSPLTCEDYFAAVV